MHRTLHSMIVACTSCAPNNVAHIISLFAQTHIADVFSPVRPSLANISFDRVAPHRFSECALCECIISSCVFTRRRPNWFKSV